MMRKAFVAALLLAQAVFPLSVVATVKSLAIVVKPVVGEVTYLVPRGRRRCSGSPPPLK